jgi:hypothetical protein
LNCKNLEWRLGRRRRRRRNNCEFVQKTLDFKKVEDGCF